MASGALRVLMLGQIVFATLGISEVVFAGLGRLKALFLQSLILVLLNILFALVLVPRFGIEGAALASSFMKNIGLQLLNRQHMFSLIAFLVCLSVCMVTKNLQGLHPVMWLTVYSVAFGLMVYALKYRQGRTTT